MIKFSVASASNEDTRCPTKYSFDVQRCTIVIIAICIAPYSSVDLGE